MEKPNEKPESILLKDFEKQFNSLGFLIDPIRQRFIKEEDISVKAGILVGKLYDNLYKQYLNINEKSLVRTEANLSEELLELEDRYNEKRAEYNNVVVEIDDKKTRAVIAEKFLKDLSEIKEPLTEWDDEVLGSRRTGLRLARREM